MPRLACPGRSSRSGTFLFGASFPGRRAFRTWLSAGTATLGLRCGSSQWPAALPCSGTDARGSPNGRLAIADTGCRLRVRARVQAFVSPPERKLLRTAQAASRFLPGAEAPAQDTRRKALTAGGATLAVSAAIRQVNRCFSAAGRRSAASTGAASLPAFAGLGAPRAICGHDAASCAARGGRSSGRRVRPARGI